MKPCRECKHPVSEQAYACPNCGAPYPARAKWDGWGYEYKSGITIAGLPLVHIAFKYRPNRTPVVACGVIAIGQFGCGVVTIAQFGVGLVSVSQFAAGGLVLAQFGVGYALIAQFGLYVSEGYGQMVRSVSQLLGM
ncbi:MAG: zinc ribbon domain-containing protein [Pseudomonadota bacterium]